MQIASFSCRRIYFQVKPKFTLKIIFDIADDFLLRRCGKAGYGNRGRKLLVYLEFFNKISDIKVIYTEILPPSRKAMCLIDNKPHNIA